MGFQEGRDNNRTALATTTFKQDRAEPSAECPWISRVSCLEVDLQASTEAEKYLNFLLIVLWIVIYENA